MAQKISRDSTEGKKEKRFSGWSISDVYIHAHKHTYTHNVYMHTYMYMLKIVIIFIRLPES